MTKRMFRSTSKCFRPCTAWSAVRPASGVTWHVQEHIRTHSLHHPLVGDPNQLTYMQETGAEPEEGINTTSLHLFGASPVRRTEPPGVSFA
jgi:hypothetical protein